MARHVRIINKPSFDGNNESDSTITLAKSVYDVVNGNTVIAIAMSKDGRDNSVIVIYDTA